MSRLLWYRSTHLLTKEPIPCLLICWDGWKELDINHVTWWFLLLHYVALIVPPLTVESLRRMHSLCIRDRTFGSRPYRWSIVTVSTPSSLGETELASKLSELHLIKKRLLIWYADEMTSFIRLEILQGSTYPQSVVRNNFYLDKRWSDLMDNVDDAYVQFRGLQLTESSDPTPIISGSPLFCRVC